VQTLLIQRLPRERIGQHGPVTLRVIKIESLAPTRPAFGAPCNGCGACCLSEPCPVGMLVSRRRHGRCAALQWESSTSRYRCGLVTRPSRLLKLGHGLAARWLSRAVARLARRWIAAGAGCDSRAPADADDNPGQTLTSD
jgi:hypothetical protein